MYINLEAHGCPKLSQSCMRVAMPYIIKCDAAHHWISILVAHPICENDGLQCLREIHGDTEFRIDTRIPFKLLAADRA